MYLLEILTDYVTQRYCQALFLRICRARDVLFLISSHSLRDHSVPLKLNYTSVKSDTNTVRLKSVNLCLKSKHNVLGQIHFIKLKMGMKLSCLKSDNLADSTLQEATANSANLDTSYEVASGFANLEDYTLHEARVEGIYTPHEVASDSAILEDSTLHEKAGAYFTNLEDSKIHEAAADGDLKTLKKLVKNLNDKNPHIGKKNFYLLYQYPESTKQYHM